MSGSGIERFGRIFGKADKNSAKISLKDYIEGPALPWTSGGDLLPDSERDELRRENKAAYKLEEERPYPHPHSGPDYTR